MWECYAFAAILIILACAFGWLAKKFRDVQPLTEELANTRAENLKLQSELRLTRTELEQCRTALDSCTLALNSKQ
jgi:hypothetical protein